MFVRKVKSLADMTPVLATKTARPVISSEGKIIGKFEKIDTNRHDQDTSG